MARTSNNNIGLSIKGFDNGFITGVYGGDHFGGRSLYINSENSPTIKHETSWELAKSDPIILNKYQKNSFLFQGKDFSSNRYDYYYEPNGGKNYISYDLETSWYINDIDMSEDVAVIAMKDWTSTEKYVKNSVGFNGIIRPVASRTLKPLISSTQYLNSVKRYELQMNLTSYQANSGASVEFVIEWEAYVLDAEGNIIGQTPMSIEVVATIPCGTSMPASITVPVDCIYGTTPSITSSTPLELCGDPFSNLTYSLNINASNSICAPTCTGAFQGYTSIVSNSYYPPINCLYKDGINYWDSSKLSYIDTCGTTPENIQMLPIILTSSAVDFIVPEEEVLDFSDIYFEVEFTPDETGIVQGTVYGAGLPSGQNTKIYSYNGTYDINEFVSKLRDTGTLSHILSDEENYNWYLVKNQGTFGCDTISTSPLTTKIVELSNYSIYLSSYIKPTGISLESLLDNSNSVNHDQIKVVTPINLYYEDGNINTQFFSELTEIETIIKGEGYAIDIDSVKVNKYSNFLNCGKVDLYTKKYGYITDITNGIITSSGHQLSSLDIIKVSCALSSDEGVTELNGVHYVSGVSSNEFKLFHDLLFAHPVSTGNLKTISGVTWTAKSPTNWTYRTSLYSPMGKNGYGFVPQIRSVVETGIVDGSISGRAVVSDIYEGSYIKPQAYFDGKRSWTNFYPMERISKVSDTNDSLMYNGNKFGADVQIQKYGNDNILMITEPGAEVSFRLFDDFFIEDQNTNNYPENKTVIPNYLPYGRVHFYRLSENSLDPNWIEYIGTASMGSGTNPWKTYESLNLEYRKETSTQPYIPGRGKTYENYTIDNNTVITLYNSTADNYWLGSRFYSWNMDMNYNQSINFYLPDQDMHPNEFGFLDYFGKSAAFDIDSGILHCVTSTNSKYAGFTNASGLPNVVCQSMAFSVNLSNSGISNYSGIVNRSTFVTVNYEQQWDEIEKYAYNIDFDDSKLIIGWPASYRGNEYLFVYDRSGSGYISRQTLISNGNYGFGDYFVADNKYIVTDKKTNNLSYLQIYKLDNISNRYYLSQTVSPTVDISDPIYEKLTSDKYVMTNNLSYDNTTGNSATQTVNLYGKYDIYENSLVFRDYNELVYMYNYGNEFKVIDHSFVVTPINYTNTAILRMRPSETTVADGNFGSQFVQSLDILEGCEQGITSNYNNLYSKSYINPSFVPLFLKTIEGIVQDSGTSLYTTCFETFQMEYPSGFNFYISGPVVYSSSGDLFMKQIDPSSGDLNLFMKQVDPFSSGTSLFIKDKEGRGSLDLTISPIFYNSIPMTVKTYNYQSIEDGTGNIIYYDTLNTANGNTSLYMENYYTGVPNVSGNMNFFILTDPYEDFARSLTIAIGKDNPQHSTGVNFASFGMDSTGSIFSTPSLYMAGPQFEIGTENSGTLNLVIKRIIEAITPLTVYNTYESGYIYGYIRGANVHSDSGVNLSISGVSLPTENNNSITLRTRGTRL